VIDSARVSYEFTIKPIINRHCAKCHDGRTWDINLTNFSKLRSAALDGALNDAIKRRSSSKPMPPDYKLSDCDIEKINIWIGQNAPNN
jgi:hypothetical protein